MSKSRTERKQKKKILLVCLKLGLKKITYLISSSLVTNVAWRKKVLLGKLKDTGTSAKAITPK